MSAKPISRICGAKLLHFFELSKNNTKKIAISILRIRKMNHSLVFFT